jgi:hypothetical protein
VLVLRCLAVDGVAVYCIAHLYLFFHKQQRVDIFGYLTMFMLKRKKRKEKRGKRGGKRKEFRIF